MDLYLFYKQRVSLFRDREEECIKKEKKFPFYRLIVFIIGLVSCYFLLQVSIAASIALLLLFISLFIFIVRKDNTNTAEKKKYQLLGTLNENEIKSIDGVFDFFDDGARYKSSTHPYSHDLDIFGPSSTFHFVNRTTLSKSSDLLADWLLHPADNTEINERNEAVNELSRNIEWRQCVFVLGHILANRGNNIENLIKWVKNESGSLSKSYMLFCSVLSGFTFISIALAFVYSIYYVPAILLLVHAVIILRSNIKVKIAHAGLTRNSHSLESYAGVIDKIERECFTSPKLNCLKALLKSDNNIASKEIKHLSGIVNNLDLRYNVYVHPILNTMFFWDIHQLYRLGKWKKSHTRIDQWLHCVAEFEALSSFANMHFNNPEWCFPKISDKDFFFEAKSLGHPLIIQKQRVCNDLSINGKAKILLLTGSNMSGKSTFLRTLGVNMVFAMAGSSVCASDFTFSPLRILSSMRIEDSLKDSASSFFAELKKLESIIKAVEKKERVFLLLDEILRGTNSTDRHIGSKALIKQFILNEAVGIIATHDLTLTDMSNDFPANIENYNFNIKMNNDDLYFDYQLNKGVCTSLNASILMRKMGINIE